MKHYNAAKQDVRWGTDEEDDSQAVSLQDKWSDFTWNALFVKLYARIDDR